MDRRTLLKALAASAFAGKVYAGPVKDMKDIKALQDNWKNFLPAGATLPSPGEPLKLSKDESQKRLPPDSFRVLREESTERAGTSPLNDESPAGIFVCCGCDLIEFTSEMNLDS